MLYGPGIERRWERDFPHSSRPALGTVRFLFNGYRVSIPGVKRLGRRIEHTLHLAPRLKKEYSYTSTPPLGHRGLFWGELDLYVYRTYNHTLNTHTILIYIHTLYWYIYIHTYIHTYIHACGPGSSVGLATDLRAGLSGIESRWGRDFPPIQTNPGAHSASCKMGTASFPGVKCGPGVLLTTHPLLVPRSWRVWLYLYPPSGSHRACNGITLPLHTYILTYLLSNLLTYLLTYTTVVFNLINNNVKTYRITEQWILLNFIILFPLWALMALYRLEDKLWDGLFLPGNRGSTVVKVPCYKSEGRWLDSSRCHEIFHWHKILPITLWPWGRFSL